MPPPYRAQHWATFSGIPFVAAGAIGASPAQWATRHGLNLAPLGGIALPVTSLSRLQVRQICQNPKLPVLYGYLCAMAWGGQGAGPGGTGSVANAWGASSKVARKLTTLRTGALTRCDGYNLFVGDGGVPGLGPAYFTKLLYFFSPNPDSYIMDQWTGRSINLLTGNTVVRLVRQINKKNSKIVYVVTRSNSCCNYQAYCEEVDHIARILHVTGDQAEEMLMSKGGKKNVGQWRAHVRPVNPLVSRYSSAKLRILYPNLPQSC